MHHTNIKNLRKTFILQQDQQDCGVACLLSIIKYYGGTASLENLRRLSGTNITGTTMLGLYQTANKTGFTANGCEADMAALINHPEPLILHVTIENNLQHYVVCYGTVTNNGEIRFIIGDPTKGIVNISKNELEKIWLSKSCITLLPNDTFIKESILNNRKWQWIKTLLHEDFSILGIAAGIGVAIAALGLAMAIFSQRLIDDILPKKDLIKLNLGIVLLIVLLLFKEAFTFLRQYFLLCQSKDFNTRIIDFFYNHLLHLPKVFFDTRKIGDLTARLNDTTRIQRVISQIAGNVIIDLLITLVTLGFLFSYSWKIAFVCLCALPFYFLLIRSQTKNISISQQNVMAGYAMSESNYISTLQGIEAIKNYNRQKLFAAGNKKLYQNYQDKVFSLGKIQIKLSLLANCFGIIFLIGILFYNSNQVLAGHLKTGELMAILGMCSSLLPSIANLALLSIPLNEAKVAFNRMFEFTSLNKEKQNDNVKHFQFQSLQITDLCFRFAGRSKLLQNINFEITKGEIIAIMGENGCGKSTLSQILLKNHLPESGKIMINGIEDLENISFEIWRNIIGIVPQNIHIFNGTVLDNIAFDDIAKNPQAVLNFLQEYGFDKFIETLPQSYMTLIGEEGINLSGGQKQIIALARALYHKPQLLILDEATAAMDRESEIFVLKLLKRLKKEIAVIFITHRLHVLKSFCDRIYLLQNGKITISGTHTELLQTDNLYSAYWKDLQ
jgi:ATP-binding cassette, subfamily C, bacteriocin exporter